MRKLILSILTSFVLLFAANAQNSYTINASSNINIFTPDTVQCVVGDTIHFILNGFHDAVEVDQASWLANNNGTNVGFNFSSISMGGTGSGTIVVDSATTHFFICTPHISLTPPMKGLIIVSAQQIPGCTDSTAINYDPFATVDDGSCIYCTNDSTFSTVVACDNFIWDGITYDSSGFYTNIYTDSLGCDSTHTLDLTINYSNSGSSTISACDNFVWDGTTYNLTGVYSNIYTNSNGCDSTHTLNLTINNSDSSFTNAEACESYNWNGQTYNQSGTYYQTVANNITGCDSVLVLNLTINNQYNGGIQDNTVGGGGFYSGNRALVLDCFVPSKIESATIYAQTNDNYTFELRDNGGNVLQTTTVPLVQGANRVNLNFDIPVGNDFELGVPGGHSGMYRNNQGVNYPYDFSNLLSIKSSNSGSPFNFYYFFYDIAVSQNFVSNINICSGETYSIGGNNYDSTGTYIDTLLSSIGCDSIVTTNLTVNPVFSIVFSDTLCSGQSVIVGSNIYDSTGVYFDTLTTVNGCDSIILTDLFVQNSSASFTVNSLSICEGDTAFVGTSFYLNSGNYSDTLINVNGCDSIVQTSLDVIPTQNYFTYTICSGDSVTVGTSTYNQTGNYTDTLFNTLGCDSIVYTEVIVYDQYNSMFNGISDNTVGGGGYYNSQSQYLIFSCYSQTEILSSLVYSQDTNSITFELRDNNGNVLQDTTHLLVPGPQRVILNFDVMPANDLQLGVSTPGSGLWRNNQGVNYPYDFGAFASITSSNAGNQFYYFYYDIEMRPSANPSTYELCDGDTLNLLGNVYTTSGLYIDTLISSVGCDSLVYSQVNFYPNVTYTNNQIICDGEVYVINGNSYDSSGTYIDTLFTSYGCDSIITTNLNVLTVSSSSSTNNQIICLGDTLNLHSNQYYQAGTYIDTLLNVNGCDSIVTTNLSIQTASYNNYNGGILDTAIAPGAFSNYNGALVLDASLPSIIKSANVYSQDTNTVTFELRGSTGNILESITHTVYPGVQRLVFDFYVPSGTDYELGIDGGNSGLYRSNAGNGNSWSYPYSVGSVTIQSSNVGNQYYYFYYDIEVKPLSSLVNYALCAGDSISISGQTYTSNATRFDTLTASNLCDSIVFSNIEFIAPSVGYQTFVICSGDSVQVMNSTYYSSGTYIDTVYQIGYCDSLVSTEVIVLPSTPVNIFATGLNTNVICLGDTITLTAPGFLSYYWYKVANFVSLLPTYTDVPNETTTYSLTAVDSNLCVSSGQIEIIVDSCVSNINTLETRDLEIFPNPTTDEINILLENIDKVDVFNVLGERMITKSFDQNTNSTKLSLGAFKKGTYFINIRSKNGKVYSRKISLVK